MSTDCQPSHSLVVTVHRIAFELFAIVEESTDKSLEAILQIADERAPAKIPWQVSDRHAKAGEHHQGHSVHGPHEGAVLSNELRENI